jgi:hypothetical protein
MVAHALFYFDESKIFHHDKSKIFYFLTSQKYFILISQVYLTYTSILSLVKEISLLGYKRDNDISQREVLFFSPLLIAYQFLEFFSKR